MKQTTPLHALFVLSTIGALTAIVAGLYILAVLLAVAAAGCLLRQRIRQNAASRPPRPVITYLPQPVPHAPLVHLQRGQFITIPWPHTLQVALPKNTHLKILETTPERLRLMAV